MHAARPSVRNPRDAALGQFMRTMQHFDSMWLGAPLELPPSGDIDTPDPLDLICNQITSQAPERLPSVPGHSHKYTTQEVLANAEKVAEDSDTVNTLEEALTVIHLNGRSLQAAFQTIMSLGRSLLMVQAVANRNGSGEAKEQLKEIKEVTDQILEDEAFCLALRDKGKNKSSIPNHMKDAAETSTPSIQTMKGLFVSIGNGVNQEAINRFKSLYAQLTMMYGILERQNTPFLTGGDQMVERAPVGLEQQWEKAKVQVRTKDPTQLAALRRLLNGRELTRAPSTAD